MATLLSEWSYVKNESGSLYIIDTTPDNIVRHERGWKYKNGHHEWISVNRSTHTPEGYSSAFNVLAKTIDLSDIPEPSWEEGPMVIMVTTSTNYYYTDGNN